MKVMFKKDSEYVILPVAPHINLVERQVTDEEFETADGKILLLLGNKGLRSFAIDSFFPSKIYPWAEIGSVPIPRTYIDFFEKYLEEKEIIRVIIISKYKVVLNMECRYNFQYGITDRAGDVPYSLDVIEYIRPEQEEKNGI